jgi:hypothetical protein
MFDRFVHLTIQLFHQGALHTHFPGHYCYLSVKIGKEKSKTSVGNLHLFSIQPCPLALSPGFRN